MRSIVRALASIPAALLALGAFAPGALAAAPAHDVFSGAIPATIGFSDVLDTTEATTDADDAQLNASCGAPATDASVWYTIAGTGSGVVVDVSGSNYPAGVLVGTGGQGNLTTVACAPGAVGFLAEAGETYYVLAIDDQSDGSGNGGQLSITFDAIPPPPTIDLTVNRTGTVSTKTGVATISGTFTCTGADFIDIGAELRQDVGRFSILGNGGFSVAGDCDGQPHPWTADVVPQAGKFAGGKAATVVFAFGCGPFACGDGFAEAVLSLRGGKK